jgi:hypothetical protein
MKAQLSSKTLLGFLISTLSTISSWKERFERTVLARAIKLHAERKVMVYSNKTVVFLLEFPHLFRGRRKTVRTKDLQHRKILTFDERCQFQPKLQFLAFSITGKHSICQKHFTFSSWEYWGFVFPKISLIFQSHYNQSFRNIGPNVHHPVPKAKLPVSDFVLLVPSPWHMRDYVIYGVLLLLDGHFK